MREVLRRWLPPLGWMALIFVLSAQPDLPHALEPLADLLLKKAGHALAYGVLAWLYLQALAPTARPIRAGTRVVSVGLAVVYALSDEYHQTFVPGRGGRWSDVGVDALGALLAMALHAWWVRRRAQPLPEQAPLG